MTKTCEDFPCCGHTDLDPCGQQHYDTDAGKAYMWKHASCDHDLGWCEAEDDTIEDDEEDTDDYDDYDGPHVTSNGLA